MLIVWVAVFIVALIIEVATAGLTTCWFAVGALVAFAVALFSDSVLLQIVVFFAVSILLLIFTRPLLKKAFRVGFKATNYDRCIGRVVIVEETIDNIASVGMVKIDGIEWTARSEDDSVVIEKGERVRIVRIEGVRVFVEKVTG